MMEEIWKDIKGYEGDYQVSSFGNVRSLRYANNGPNKKGSGVKNLKPILNGVGYYVVNLYNNGKMKQHHIHRLVAEAFLPNPDNYPVIDHINTITIDNRVENLRFCSIKDNVNNPISSKRRLDKCRKTLRKLRGGLHHSSKRVAQYTKDGVFVKVWDSMSDVSRELGIDSGALTKACQGIQKSTGGFIWRYCEREIEKTEIFGT